MNFFCDSGGNIFHVDPEKVYQGSANANTIYFIGAFASNLSVTIAYRLPNGLWTTPILMTAVTDSALANIQDAQGQGYSVWTVKITGTITERYGTVDVQFFVYGNNGTTDGSVLATALSSFEVSKGVPITLPSTPTDNYEVLLTDILAALSTAHGEITYIEEDIRQIKTEQATQNTAIATNQALIDRAEGNIDILYGQDRNQSILIEQNRASILSLHEEVSTLQGGKVDKIYDPNIVYGTNDAGAAVGIPYSANSDPLSIIQRDENGRAQIESPLNGKDIANKEFVENLVKPVSVNTQSNTAKIENLTNILLDNSQVAIAGYSMESEKTYDCVKGGALDRRLKKIEQALKNNL